MTDSPLPHALALAARGYPVFPVIEDGKLPAIKGWRTRATTDEATIRQWWAARPYNVGVATGYPVPYGGYLMVVDLDMKTGKDGRLSLAMLELEHGPIATTFTVVTPTLGRPLYFPTANPDRSNFEPVGKGKNNRG